MTQVDRHCATTACGVSVRMGWHRPRPRLRFGGGVGVGVGASRTPPTPGGDPRRAHGWGVLGASGLMRCSHHRRCRWPHRGSAAAVGSRRSRSSSRRRPTPPSNREGGVDALAQRHNSRATPAAGPPAAYTCSHHWRRCCTLLRQLRFTSPCCTARCWASSTPTPLIPTRGPEHSPAHQTAPAR